MIFQGPSQPILGLILCLLKQVASRKNAGSSTGKGDKPGGCYSQHSSSIKFKTLAFRFDEER